MHRGYLRAAQSRFAEALRTLGDAEQIAASNHLRPILLDIRLRKAMVYFFAADYIASEKLYAAVLKEVEDAEDGNKRLLALAGIGKNNMIRGKFQNAVEWFQKALDIASETGEAHLAATMRSELGWCFYNLDENDKALALFREAESAFCKSGAKHNYGICLGNIGNVFYKNGDYATAITYYCKALAISRGINDKISEGKWLKNLTIVSGQMGDAVSASKYELEAMQARLQIENERFRVKQAKT